MTKLKIISGLAAMFVTLPIWLYLLYTMLKAIDASELTWFLFWVYIPFTMLVHAIAGITSKE